jgi:hypothetical protein
VTNGSETSAVDTDNKIAISAPIINPGGTYNPDLNVGELVGYGLDDVTAINLSSSDGGPTSATLTPVTSASYGQGSPTPVGNFEGSLYPDDAADPALTMLWFTLPPDEQATQDSSSNWSYTYSATVTSPEGTSAPQTVTFN